jgi:hypothetical protein
MLHCTSDKAVRLLYAALFVLAVVTTDAFGYGPIGHEIVGAIADERLSHTPAWAKVAALIDGFSLEKAAVIADEIKGWDKRGADDPHIFHFTAHPQVDAQLREFWKANPPTKDRNSPIPSHHWFHYCDVSVASNQKYQDGSLGRTRWDLVHMTAYCIKVLRGDIPEQNERKITRPLAVILLAHYLGDIHQPLHVGAEYFDKNGNPTDGSHGGEILEDQGGNTLTFSSLARLPITGNFTKKLHGFWDNDCVMANLPALADTMPKEERRAQMLAARRELVTRWSREEPKDWRVAAETPQSYAEALANEALPLAREAHARLRFSGVHAQQDETGAVFASGEAEERPASDNLTYAEWSRNVVGSELHKAGWRLAELLQQVR